MAKKTILFQAQTQGDAWRSKADKLDLDNLKIELENNYQTTLIPAGNIGLKTVTGGTEIKYIPSKKWVKVGTFTQPVLNGGIITQTLNYTTKENTNYYVTYQLQPYKNPMDILNAVTINYFYQIKQAGYFWYMITWTNSGIGQPAYFNYGDIGTEKNHLYCTNQPLDLSKPMKVGDTIIYAVDLYEEQDVTTT